MIRAGLFAACLLTATGCSAEAEPQPLPPLAAPTTSANPLALPSEAVPATPQGAAAFATYYLALLDRAFEEGDAQAVRAASDPGCGTCANLARAIEAKPTPGERIEGGNYEVLFAEAPAIEGGDVTVEVRYTLTEVRVYGPDDELLRSTPALTSVDSQLRLLRTDNEWRVLGFRTVNS